MAQSPNSDTTTRGIRILAAARYLPEQSDPDRPVFVYVYQIRIENVGDRRAQLLSRHWVIVDAHGNRDEVRGPGVVGENPDLAPGKSFEYRSSCTLSTEWGTMEGTYRFRAEDGEDFDVTIGRFFLVPTSRSMAVS